MAPSGPPSQQISGSRIFIATQTFSYSNTRLFPRTESCCKKTTALKALAADYSNATLQSYAGLSKISHNLSKRRIAAAKINCSEFAIYCTLRGCSNHSFSMLSKFTIASSNFLFIRKMTPSTNLVSRSMNAVSASSKNCLLLRTSKAS